MSNIVVDGNLIDSTGLNGVNYYKDFSAKIGTLPNGDAGLYATTIDISIAVSGKTPVSVTMTGFTQPGSCHILPILDQNYSRVRLIVWHTYSGAPDAGSVGFRVVYK